MDKLRKQVIDELIDINAGDPKRIGHFLKVNAYADLIAQDEGLSDFDRQVLDTASLLHDVAVKELSDTYGYADGKQQEVLGAVKAGEILDELGAGEELIDRVCFLISKHHTYEDIEDPLLQILIEADFLVNAYEDGLEPGPIKAFMNKVFKTESGKKLLKKTYAIA